MKSSKLFKICSVIVLALGVIHTLAIPIIAPVYRVLGKTEQLSATYMFVATGIATFFTGWLQFYLIKCEFQSYILKILRYSALFLLILGLGAVSTMWNNPFAYIVLIVAITEIKILFTKKIKHE